MDRHLTGRDLFGGGKWDFGPVADETAYLAAIVPGLSPHEKARLSRELLEIIGNRSETLSTRIKAAAAIAFQGEDLGLRGSATLARALIRVVEEEFLGGRAARNKPLAQAGKLQATCQELHYTFLVLLLADIVMAHHHKGRLFRWRLARLATGTKLGCWLRRTLGADKPARRPKSRRRSKE